MSDRKADVARLVKQVPWLPWKAHRANNRRRCTIVSGRSHGVEAVMVADGYQCVAFDDDRVFENAWSCGCDILDGNFRHGNGCEFIDAILGLRSEWYARYLLSPGWRRIRNEAVSQDGAKCAMCGSIRRLQVHHLTYDRLGRESLEDLITLCRKCHRKVEGRDQPGDQSPRRRNRRGL